MRAELQEALDLAATLDAADVPAFLADLEHVRMVAFARIVTPALAPPDRLIDIKELSDRLGVSEDFIYRNQAKYKSFARRQGKKLLFSASGLDSYLRKSR